jgi:hypothetical protein
MLQGVVGEEDHLLRLVVGAVAVAVEEEEAEEVRVEEVRVEEVRRL